MSFINTIFLFATAAAVLPVLYHLVRRMKAKTVPFSSLMFLKATPKELIKKRRLRDRLLMAARSAIFLLLALAFARPYLPTEQLPFVPQRENESVVILLDRSFSLQHAGAFERAVEAVRAQLDGAEAGDEIALVAFDEAPQLVAPLERDFAVHRGALEALEPSYRSTDYFPALQRAQDLLQEARHDRRVVVMISDFQDAGWTGALDNWKLSTDISFEPVPVGAAYGGNGYIEAFEISGQRANGRYAARYDARVTGLSAAREARLTVGSVEIDRRRLEARSSAPLTFQMIPEREGFYQGVLTLDADELPGDDRYFFTGQVAPQPGVLVVDSPGRNAPRDAFYLRSAFDLGEASRFRFAAEERLSPAALRSNDVVFLTNRSADAEPLKQFVESGGSVVVSPGDAVEAASLNLLLQELGIGRVTAFVDPREEQGYEAIIGEMDLRHPVFEAFAGSGTVLQPKFRRYARLQPDDGARVIARFDSGDPFLVERSVGRGLVVFYASTFNTSWTDLPLDEMYVPFVYQLAGYGSGRRDLRHVFTVGETVDLSGAPGETWEVRAPGDRIYRVTLDANGRGVFRETEVPGHYTAAAGLQTRMFSVNVDPRESNLAARDAEEVYAAVVAPPEDEPRTPEQAAAAVVESDERKQKLWRWLLLGVIVLFGVESWMANRAKARERVRG